MQNKVVFVLVVFIVVVFSNCSTIDQVANQSEYSEKLALIRVRNIIYNQIDYRKANGKFTNKLENVDKKISGVTNNLEGYNFEMSGNEKAFEVWASPKEYGKTGKISFYADTKSEGIKGGDHKGEKSSFNDPIIEKYSDDILNEIYQQMRKL
jgi:hypothetical protein